MKPIYQSASKIVFILMALGVVILTILRILEAKDFMVLASMAFTFYFTKPSTPATDTTQQKDTPFTT